MQAGETILRRYDSGAESYIKNWQYCGSSIHESAGHYIRGDTETELEMRLYEKV